MYGEVMCVCRVYTASEQRTKSLGDNNVVRVSTVQQFLLAIVGQLHIITLHAAVVGGLAVLAVLLQSLLALWALACANPKAT